MHRLSTVTTLLLIISGLVLPGAHAEKLSTELRIELQTAMLSFNDSILTDGSYHYLDTKKNLMSQAYPANAHPFVVTLGDNYFVCSEFIDDNGHTMTADYLVRMINGQYKVVQMILDDRDSLVRAMKKYGN